MKENPATRLTANNWTFIYTLRENENEFSPK